MELILKLSYNNKDSNPGLLEWYNDLITNKNILTAKLSTKRLDIERDTKDARNIKSLRKIEIAIELVEGFLVLKGHLGCSYKQPFGGEFYIIDYKEISNGKFSSLNGVPVDLMFDNNYPTTIENMYTYLYVISSDSNFVFNIGQFDEFMEVFKFYKTLSDEINNSATYEIKEVSSPYYYLPVDTKELFDEENNILSNYVGIVTINDKEDLIKGYRIPNYIYDRFNNELKDITMSLVDIHIDYQEHALRKIQKMRDNIFVSDYKLVDEKNAKNIRELEFVNLYRQKDRIIINVNESHVIKEKFLNLYDMGQKIKIESIENSLRLINQGNTGASMKMIEYLIGDEAMPSANSRHISNQAYIQSELRVNKVKEKYIKELNESQQIAFLKSVDGLPVTLIKGPPGTGKTHVINAVTQYITKELHEKVVISSQTHVAIDNVLDKLMENYDLVIPNRITNRRNKYSLEEIDKTIYKNWGLKIDNHLSRCTDQTLVSRVKDNLKNFNGKQEIEYSRNMINEFSVIGATTTTSAISGKKGLELLKDYKWLIIDEVSKSPITEVLRYLPYVDNIILVGDDYQLSPLLEFSKEDVKHLPSYDDEMYDKLQTIYEQSIFSKTINKARAAGRLIVLEENYRSVKDVLAAYNVFYDGKLKNMRENINPRKVQFGSQSSLSNNYDVFFVEPLGATEKDDSKSHSRYNIQEAQATALILEDILKNVINPSSVSASAIFPYAAQIEYFTKNYKDLINRAKKVLKSFELDTVDAFQGRETDIVLVNTVVTRLDKKNFLKDFRRINVSMSRAKDKLVVFGSRDLMRLEMDTPDGGTRQYFRSIIEAITRDGKTIKVNQKGEIISNESTSKTKFA
ncbi:MAG: AAA domain-containing protein [Candidatus Izemoplasmatales bacterium]